MEHPNGTPRDYRGVLPKAQPDTLPPTGDLMIAALTQLLLFQLVGEVVARGFGLPIPGPVIGMALLFAFLALRGGPGEDLQKTTQGLLQHLSLLFVPAGTGVMLHLHRLQDEWLPILLSLLVSTAATLAVTALVMKAFMRPATSPEQG